MLYLVEIAIVAYLAFECWGIVRASAIENLIRLGIFAVSLFGAWIVYALADKVTPSFSPNVLVQMGANVVAAIVALNVIDLALSRLLLKKRRAPPDGAAERAKPRSILPRWLDRAIVATFLAAFLALSLLFLDLLVKVVAQTDAGDAIAERTFLLKRFLRGPGPGAASGGSRNPFLQALARARRYLSERTGMESTLKNVAALRGLRGMTNEEKRQVVESSPSLKRVVENPAAKAALRSERVMRLIDEVSRGSVNAIYKLGEEPEVNALARDEDFRRAVQEVDLVDVQRKLRALRQAGRVRKEGAVSPQE